jgi:hypothetical protein
MQCIQEASPQLSNPLFGKYALTKFALIFILRQILESDAVGKEMILTPREYIRDQSKRNRMQECIKTIVNDIIIDVNGEVESMGDDFDYRGKLRDSEWVRNTARSVVGNYLKLVQRGRIKPLAEEWQSTT